MSTKAQQISALLVAPDKSLAEQFAAKAAKTRAFDILAVLDSYPQPQALEARLRQYRPDVLLLDVATSLDVASELIRFVTSSKSPLPVIGLHTHNDSEAILRSLRFGACEFLYAPFEVSIQEAAITRIQKLLAPLGGGDRERGRVVVFSSVKPGSGASTLAVQTAYAIRRATNRRVLVADFDLIGGSTGFFLDVQQEESLVDVLKHQGRMTHELWSTVTADADGIDVLPAPAMPCLDAPDFRKLNEIVEYARSQYDWTVIDLPTIFSRLSIMSVSESDRAFLVATSELASLHMARRAVKLLAQLGVDSQKFQVLINRIDERNELSASDLTKLFDCRVDTSLPDDKLGIQLVVTSGTAVPGDSPLGKAIDSLAGKLMGALPESKREYRQFLPRPLLSHS